MGGRTANEVVKRDVAPIFQVISDLERPDFNFSEGSCCQSLYSEYTNLVVHHRQDSDFGLEKYPTVIRVPAIENLAEANQHGDVVLRSSFRRSVRRKRSRMRNGSGSLVVRPGELRKRSQKKRRSKPTPSLGMFSLMDLEAYERNDFDAISNSIEHFDKSDCPTYEVPKDVIPISQKPNKKTMRNKLSKFDTENNNGGNENRQKRKKATKKIIKNYEEMLETLLKKCQRNDCNIQKKDELIERLKVKLKKLIYYNTQFADENVYMRKQHDDMKSCIEHYKTYCTSLEEQTAKTGGENFDKKIISTCANCGANEAANIRYEKVNAALNEDILMLKNVVYRLNVQMNRYQDKLRSVSLEKISMPSLPHFDETEKDELDAAKQRSENVRKNLSSNVQMAWGNVNTHTLAPLLNAYQESIMEKDNLIRDYEKEFNRFTSKLKVVVEENDAMHRAISKMGGELASLKEISGLAIAERDSLRKDCELLKTRNIELDSKLKTDTESYQLKVDTMTRDFSVIHQEYFKTKTGFAAIQGKCKTLEEQNKDLQKDSQVPIKVHNMRIDECKILFDELKLRYDEEKNKLSTRLSILQDSNSQMEKRIINITGEKSDLENKMKNYVKIAKKCQHDLSSLRTELAATQSSRDVFKRRSTRAINLCRQLVLALNKTASGTKTMKAEKMVAQKEVMKNLDIVEDKLKEQEKSMQEMKSENLERVGKLEDMIKEKDALIKAMKQHIEGERLKRYADMNPYGKTAEDIIKKNSMRIPPTKPARSNPPPSLVK